MNYKDQLAAMPQHEKLNWSGSLTLGGGSLHCGDLTIKYHDCKGSGVLLSNSPLMLLGNGWAIGCAWLAGAEHTTPAKLAEKIATIEGALRVINN